MHDGRPGGRRHNALPLLLQQRRRRLPEAVRGNDFMFFTRSGYAGSQATRRLSGRAIRRRASTTRKGLPAQVRPASARGSPASRTGGATSAGTRASSIRRADKEVYLRWAEFGALSPGHARRERLLAEARRARRPSGRSGPTPRRPRSTATTRRCTRASSRTLRGRREAAETGMPIIRHPFLMHPGDPAASASSSNTTSARRSSSRRWCGAARTTRDALAAARDLVRLVERSAVDGGATSRATRRSTSCRSGCARAAIVAMLDPCDRDAGARADVPAS